MELFFQIEILAVTKKVPAFQVCGNDVVTKRSLPKQ